MALADNPTPQPVIRIRGARTHNLRNVDIDLPAGALIVMTGVSGSGKSSLAIDTLFAEGQRRYLESVAVQTRSILRQVPRPDVDEITGLAPAISLDQRVSAIPIRTTLAMATEIHDYLRLLYSRGGTAHCTRCGRPVQRQSVDQILSRTLQLPDRTRLMVLSPVVRGRRGAHRDVLDRMTRNGFVRARIDGELVDLSEVRPLAPGRHHSIEAVVDRIVLKEGITPRLRESIELACRESDGTCMISHEVDSKWIEKFYSVRFSCPDCDLSFPTPEPRSFSFNSPWGACQECSGLGFISGETPEVQRCCPVCSGARLQPFARGITFLGLTLQAFSRLSVEDALTTIDTWITETTSAELADNTGLTQEARLVAQRTLPEIRARLQCLREIGIGYLTLDRPARTLSGGEFQRARLAASLSSQLHGVHFVLDEPTAGLHPRDTHKLLKALFALRDAGGTVIVVEHDGEMMRAADWIVDLGPGAGADGGQLLFSGTPKDAALYAQSPTGEYLRGAFVRVAEESTPEQKSSGHIVPPEQKSSGHETGAASVLTIRNARLHNLKNLTVEIPLHRLVCVTGVSGSGKSSLLIGTLLPVLSTALNERLWNRDSESSAAVQQRVLEVCCDRIDGMNQIKRILSLDQSPVGQSSRSCVATISGIWNDVRRLFAKTRDARAKGMSSKHFSFNSGEGRCPECRGTGTRSLRMSFLPDAVIPCAACHGLRFSKAVCSVRYRSKSVADVLQMRVDEAAEFFSELAALHSILATYCSVGLGYLPLGQPSTTFSGGEAQRAKLAAELSSPAIEHTLYVLDEPTSGLHPADVHRLFSHLRQLISRGHSIVVIEHQLDVIRAADWVLDIGPGSADQGGALVFAGTPRALAASEISETGAALRKLAATH
jgi:excinuclease ABC subunit A